MATDAGAERAPNVSAGASSAMRRGAPLRARLRSDSGAGGATVLMMCAVLILLTTGVLGAFRGFLAHQQANIAADAAALAASDAAMGYVRETPCAAAARAATGNGASVTSCELDGLIATVRVVVQASPFTLSAAARAGPDPNASGVVAVPIAGSFTITDGYGPRIAPVAGASSDHPAIDLVAPLGEPIYAIQSAQIVSISEYWVETMTPDGTRISYLHMYRSDVTVNPGDWVSAGQQIGKLGNAGPSTGAHLDLRIEVSGSARADLQALPLHPAIASTHAPKKYVDPIDYFRMHGVDLCAVASGGC